jgi:hypothetical protein
LIVGIKTLIAMRTLREKTAGNFITQQVVNLDTKVNEPLLVVSLFTQKCGLLKEKSNKKENSSNNSSIYNY